MGFKEIGRKIQRAREEKGLTQAELARRVDGYRLQGASYALTVRETTGEPVHRVVFAFLTPAGAVELDLEDIDAAVSEVKALVAAGAEQVTA